MPATSTMQSSAKTVRRTRRARAAITRNDVTQVTVAGVTPNDSPNVAGLRHESGPCQGRSSTANTPRWRRPETTSAPAMPYNQRSRIPTRHQRGARREQISFLHVIIHSMNDSERQQLEE